MARNVECYIYTTGVKTMDWNSVMNKIEANNEWAIVHDMKEGVWEVWTDGKLMSPCGSQVEAKQVMRNAGVRKGVTVSTFSLYNKPSTSSVSTSSGSSTFTFWDNIRFWEYMDDETVGCIVWPIVDLILIGGGFLMIQFGILLALGWIFLIVGIILLLFMGYGLLESI